MRHAVQKTFFQTILFGLTTLFVCLLHFQGTAQAVELEDLVSSIEKYKLAGSTVIVKEKEGGEHLAAIITHDSESTMLVMKLDASHKTFEMSSTLPMGAEAAAEFDFLMDIPSVPESIQNMANLLEGKHQVIIYFPAAGSVEYHILPVLA